MFTSRPSLGTKGRAIQVRANFFPVTSIPANNIHHYDIQITPEVPPAKNRRIFQLWLELNLKSKVWPCFDGKHSCYAASALDVLGGADTFTLEYFDTEDPKAKRTTPKTFILNIKKVTEINMQNLSLFLDGRTTETPHDAILAMDILLRHRPSLMYTTVGRCFYASDSAQLIANGAQLWQGFHQSVRPSKGHLLINLDVSATAFYQQGPIVDLISKILGKNGTGDFRAGLMDKDRMKIEKVMKGLKIVVVHRGQIRRKYRIHKLSINNASRTMFQVGDIKDLQPNEQMEECSVQDYFAQKYNVHLQFPNLPLLVVGEHNRQVYLPMEVCELVSGQRHVRKLNERQTAEMIKFTCQPPHIRSNKISSGITILQQRDNEYLKDFNVQIGHEMSIVNARVLSAPSISYHPASKEPLITPREGAWNLRDKMVAQGITMRSWSVVAFGSEHDYPIGAIQKFITLLPPIAYAPPNGNIEKTLIDAYMVAGNSFNERPQLLVCILPNTGVPLYAEIKRVSDTVIGIATQCIQAKHMFAAKRQYCANVCLKMNVKLGGMNSYLSPTQLPFISTCPTIIFGADVTHPAPGSASNQSIAALVGSMDAQCSRYAASIRVQTGRQEVITDLSSMVVELLKTFYQTCGAKPEKIVFYRDGLSEPMFAEALAFEVEAIRRACQTLEANYRPTLTFIVVQKRHHARFFPIRREDSDRSGNVLPGTVAESGVTHPSEFDFYLCSHPGLQGTSKPTHYHVLKDENNFSSDSLQEFTYRMCYLYCRATRSVSVCPPAYYAHLVAARARFHATDKDLDPLPNIYEDSFGDLNLGLDNLSLNGSGGGGLVGGLVGVRDVQAPPGFHTPGRRGWKRASTVYDRAVVYGVVKPELTKVMWFM